MLQEQNERILHLQGAINLDNDRDIICYYKQTFHSLQTRQIVQFILVNHKKEFPFIFIWLP